MNVIEYHENSNVKLERNSRIAIMYDEQGNKIVEFEHEIGIPNGYFIEYSNSSVTSRSLFENGELRKTVTYYPTGKLKAEFSYRDSTLYGLQKHYDLNGILSQSSHYITINKERQEIMALYRFSNGDTIVDSSKEDWKYEYPNEISIESDTSILVTVFEPVAPYFMIVFDYSNMGFDQHFRLQDRTVLDTLFYEGDQFDIPMNSTIKGENHVRGIIMNIDGIGGDSVVVKHRRYFEFEYKVN